MRISDWSSDVCSSDLVQLRGIVDVQENIQNIVIADDVGVKLHPDRLGMAGIAVADLTIGRVCDPAVGITAFHRQHALQIIEDRLHAPEAPASENRDVGGPRTSEERRAGKDRVSTCRYRW